MRFINFKTLEGKNFLSFGNTPIRVNLSPGVNAIVGSNLDKEDSKNGAGKSSITEMLYYSLYGTTLREISKDHVQNTVTNKRCEVALEFELTSNNTTDLYKIVRKLNPTKCQLFKNGEDVTRSTLAKTNALIQELIHTPSTVFQNSVIMTVNNALPFMALPKTDRRKFIESVLGLEVFHTMVLKVREDYAVTKKEYEIAYSKLEQIQTEYKFNLSQLENYETLKSERLNKLQEKKSKLQSDISLIKAKLVSCQEDTSDLDQQICLLEKQAAEIREQEKVLSAGLHKIQAEIGSEKKQIKNLLADKDNCPTCKRGYSEEHVTHIQKTIDQHEQNIEVLQIKESKIQTLASELQLKQAANDKDIKSVKASKEERVKTLADNKNNLNSISYLEQTLKEATEEIFFVVNEHNNELKGRVATIQTSIENGEQSVSKLNNDLNVLESVKFVISEEGIKSFLVKKILKILNSRLAYYLKKLEANCLCKFNEFFEEEIIDEFSQQKSYFNFSGGERKRIDLACLFAFADIRRLQGDVNFGTVFYDELLDSSLDDKGVLLTLKVLRERYQENNESCYIITHRGNHVLTKAEHTIHVVKRNGVSFIQS